MKIQSHIIIKFTVLVTVIITMLVLPAIVISQPVVKIGEYAGCTNAEILIPIEVEEFEDISAITLFIGVDFANVEYIGVENINDVFSTGEFVGGANIGSQFISLNWASVTAADLEVGIMCNIRVKFKNESVNFNFLDNCEIARSNLTVVENVDYFDGTLVEFSSFTPDPLFQSANEGSLATIELHNLPYGVSCQWQGEIDGNWVNVISQPPFSGVQSSKLSIQSVTSDMNENFFRCMLSNDICSDGSQVSELAVISSSVVELNGQSKNAPMYIYPNPVGDYLNCVFNINMNSAELRLVDVNGVIKNYYKLEDVDSKNVLSLQLEKEKTGIYFLQLFNNGVIISEMKVLKQ